MIKTKTLKALESIVGFDEMVKVVGMQAIMHSTRITKDLLPHGSFHRDVCDRFSSLLGEGKESAERAIAGVFACEEYDQRVSLEGLGGCVVIPLDVLLKRGLESSQRLAPSTGRGLDELRVLWAKLSDVPVDSNDRLEESFLHFEVGAHREDVWHWFERQNPEFIVTDEMSRIDADLQGVQENLDAQEEAYAENVRRSYEARGMGNVY